MLLYTVKNTSKHNIILSKCCVKDSTPKYMGKNRSSKRIIKKHEDK